ncbi:MAG: hypothetical protein E7Z63_06155 [Thermoplasmata archaeon]|nr:hypothetical protein [Thermoplasmata archaeon]
MRKNERVTSFTAAQCLYYVALTDYPTYKNPRTVTQASKYLGKKNHTTLSSALNSHFLTKRYGGSADFDVVVPISRADRARGSDVLYKPGKHAIFMESEIERYKNVFSRMLFKGDEENEAPVFMDSVTAEPVTVDSMSIESILKWCAKKSLSLPSFRQWRYHINGSGFVFDVTKVGRIQSFPRAMDKVSRNPVTNQVKEERVLVDQELFTQPPSGPNGCEQYDTDFLTDYGWFHLRYQHWANSGLDLFFIHPPCLEAPYLEGWTRDDLMKEFMRITFPVLRTLEECAGWEFERIPDGSAFAFHVAKGESGDGTKPGKGAKLEIGFDAPTTEMIRAKLGYDFGEVGRTPTWYDKSKKALGNGELETNDLDIVAAWEYLVHTTQLCRENRLVQMRQEEKIQELTAIVARQQITIDELEQKVETLAHANDLLTQAVEDLNETVDTTVRGLAKAQSRNLDSIREIHKSIKSHTTVLEALRVSHETSDMMARSRLDRLEERTDRMTGIIEKVVAGVSDLGDSVGRLIPAQGD